MSAEAKGDDDDDDRDEPRLLYADKLLASLCLSLVMTLLRLEYGNGFGCLISDNALSSDTQIAVVVLLSAGISVNGILDVPLSVFDFASLIFSIGGFLTAILDGRILDDFSLIVFSTGSSHRDKAIKDCCISFNTLRYWFNELAFSIFSRLLLSS
jgi:hypothetical protein